MRKVCIDDLRSEVKKTEADMDCMTDASNEAHAAQTRCKPNRHPLIGGPAVGSVSRQVARSSLEATTKDYFAITVLPVLKAAREDMQRLHAAEDTMCFTLAEVGAHTCVSTLVTLAAEPSCRQR